MDQEPKYFPSSMQIVTGYGLSLVFLVLSIQVIFPAIQVPIIGIIPSAMSMVDFVIHEAGHLIFNFTGIFIGILGGTIAQLFIPIFCSFLSFRKKRWVSLSFFQFWLGQSLIQISRYVGDARAQDLQLFSPGSVFGGPKPIHDWNYLLSTIGLLWMDHILAVFIFLLGLCALIGLLACSSHGERGRNNLNLFDTTIIQIRAKFFIFTHNMIKKPIVKKLVDLINNSKFS